MIIDIWDETIVGWAIHDTEKKENTKTFFFWLHVRYDNPFIESFFGTMKTLFNYPGRLKSIEYARECVASIVDSYHTNHRHSGIRYFTPKEIKSG